MGGYGTRTEGVGVGKDLHLFFTDKIKNKT